MGGYFHPVLKIAVFKSKLISKPSVEQIGLAGGFFIGWSNKSGMGDHLEWNVQPDLKSNISISEIARRLGCHNPSSAVKLNAIQDYVVTDRNKPKAKIQHIKQTTPIVFLTLHGLTSSTY